MYKRDEDRNLLVNSFIYFLIEIVTFDSDFEAKLSIDATFPRRITHCLIIFSNHEWDGCSILYIFHRIFF